MTVPRRLVLILAALLAFAVPASARPRVVLNKGHGHRATTDPVTLALKLAEHYWHTTPCSRQITMMVSAEEPEYATLNTGAAGAGLANGTAVIDAWATWTVGPMPYTDCIITFNEGLFGNWKTDDEYFQWFCDVMTHEVGHFLGHQDDGQTDPKSIAYPTLGPGAANFNSVSGCRHVQTFYGGRRVAEEVVSGPYENYTSEVR